MGKRGGRERDPFAQRTSAVFGTASQKTSIWSTVSNGRSDRLGHHLEVTKGRVQRYRLQGEWSVLISWTRNRRTMRFWRSQAK